MASVYTKIKRNEYMRNYYRKKRGDKFGKDKHGIKYTNEEIKFIIGNYKIMSDKSLGEKLNRSDDTIQKKLKQLKLKRTDKDIRTNFLKSIPTRSSFGPKKYVIKKPWRKMKTVSKKKRVLESHLVWCKENQIYRLPDGCVIHHLDLNPQNNSQDNLFLMTKGYHNQLHNEISKLIRSNLL
jgi:hypothetical protein